MAATGDWPERGEVRLLTKTVRPVTALAWTRGRFKGSELMSSPNAMLLLAMMDAMSRLKGLAVLDAVYGCCLVGSRLMLARMDSGGGGGGGRLASSEAAAAGCELAGLGDAGVRARGSRSVGCLRFPTRGFIRGGVGASRSEGPARRTIDVVNARYEVGADSFDSIALDSIVLPSREVVALFNVSIGF